MDKGLFHSRNELYCGDSNIDNYTTLTKEEIWKNEGHELIHTIQSQRCMHLLSIKWITPQKGEDAKMQTETIMACRLFNRIYKKIDAEQNILFHKPLQT